MSLADYPNVEKLAKLVDWALGLVYSLFMFGVGLLVLIALAILVFQ
jgi:hypothetical protein